jgi:hypothetical protein
MTDVFTERLRAAGIQPDAAADERQLAAIRTFIEDPASSAHIKDLVRLAFQNEADTSTVDALLAAVNDGVEEEHVRPGEKVRIAILACQAVIDFVGQPSRPAAVQAMLLVSSGVFQGWDAAHPDLVSEAEERTREASSTIFDLKAPPRSPGQSANAKQAIEALGSQDWDTYRRAIE